MLMGTALEVVSLLVPELMGNEVRFNIVRMWHSDSPLVR